MNINISDYNMNILKKITMVLLIAIMSIGVAEAKLRFGIKAGLNVNHLSANMTTFDKNNQAGWTAGLMTECQLPLIGLGVDLSLMYTRMNSEILIYNSDGSAFDVPNKNFIEIPLNLKYKISLPVVGSFLAPYIFTGPSFGFKLDKSTIDNFKTKTFQSVWNIGLGLELAKHLQIGASYGFGMNNIVKVVSSSTDPVKYHNNYWTVTAAYLF